MKSEFIRLIAENNGRSPFVFNYEDPRTGEYRPVTTIQRSFRAACRRAGIESMQFRDICRTCSTRLHEAGVDPLLVSRLLRHSSLKISTEVYIPSSLKLFEEDLVGRTTPTTLSCAMTIGRAICQVGLPGLVVCY